MDTIKITFTTENAVTSGYSSFVFDIIDSVGVSINNSEERNDLLYYQYQSNTLTSCSLSTNNNIVGITTATGTLIFRSPVRIPASSYIQIAYPNWYSETIF